MCSREHRGGIVGTACSAPNGHHHLTQECARNSVLVPLRHSPLFLLLSNSFFVAESNSFFVAESNSFFVAERAGNGTIVPRREDSIPHALSSSIAVAVRRTPCCPLYSKLRVAC